MDNMSIQDIENSIKEYNDKHSIQSKRVKKLRSDHDIIFNAKKLELDELESSQIDEMNVQKMLDNDLYDRMNKLGRKLFITVTSKSGRYKVGDTLKIDSDVYPEDFYGRNDRGFYCMQLDVYIVSDIKIIKVNKKSLRVEYFVESKTEEDIWGHKEHELVTKSLNYDIIRRIENDTCVDHYYSDSDSQFIIDKETIKRDEKLDKLI